MGQTRMRAMDWSRSDGRLRVSGTLALIVLVALIAGTAALAAPTEIFTTTTTVRTPMGTSTSFEQLRLGDENRGHIRLALQSGSAQVLEMTVLLGADGEIAVPFADDGVECYNMARAFSFLRRSHRDAQRNFEIELSPNENGLSVIIPMTVSVGNVDATFDPLTVRGEAHGTYSVDGTTTITHDLLLGSVQFARGAIERATFETLLFVGAPLAELTRSHACTLERGLVHEAPVST